MATYETIDDLKAGIERIKAQAQNIKSNLTRIETEYQDWEDRVRELEDAIYQAQLDAGLTKEEVVQKINEPELSLFDD
jgi:predicted  nucleic acid-binding Zn-ribbon protein